MPSFLEIPVILRVATARDGFVQWLASMPIPNPAKRKLAQLWTANTGGTLEAKDYAIIMARPAPRTVS